MRSARPPLGGLSPTSFLRDYWQKRPLLVRRAVPGFHGLLDRRALFALARGDEAESRLIRCGRGASGWQVTHGPLRARDLAGLPARDWTLLVNGVNLHSAGADALLQRFAFVPWSRLDDVMVSYAVDGGGVGPHVDSYDVFLLQGPGRRRWRLMPPARRGHALVPDAPLRLVADFRASEEMTLEPGDMLYLPPGWAHEGTALGTCQTYSIGFRAPGAADLSAAFLDFLHERGFAELAYADPGRAPALHPARIDARMLAHAARVLGRIRWNRADVGEFLGRYLSEPKQQVVFGAPRRPLARAAFADALALAGSTVRLDPRSRLLAGGRHFYLNGARVPGAASADAALLELGDRRSVGGRRLARGPCADLIYSWYLEGFVHLEARR